MGLAESSVRLDPRSSFAFAILAYLHAMQGHHEAAMAAGKRAVDLNPYDMGARGVLGICHLVIGEHEQAIELFSTAAQRGNTDPRYKWSALNAFSHYLLGHYDAALSWSREALYSNPNHLQMLAIRTAALAQLARTEEAARAAEALLGSYPGFTIERHLRNFRWKKPADIAHYRDGLGGCAHVDRCVHASYPVDLECDPAADELLKSLRCDLDYVLADGQLVDSIIAG